MKWAPANVAESSAALARGADLGSFAMVMATGLIPVLTAMTLARLRSRGWPPPPGCR